MPPPGGAPFPVGTVLNTHGTGDYPNFHYQGTVSQGIAGLLTVRYFESPHYYNCVSVYTYSQCSSMMSRGHMTLDPTAGYSRVDMAGVRVGDPVRVRWDDGTHYQATVRKINSDGTLAVTYPDGGGCQGLRVICDDKSSRLSDILSSPRRGTERCKGATLACEPHARGCAAGSHGGRG